jgi:glutamine amidotransferase
VQGNTDTETFFFLALTYGLQNDPKAALQKMVRRVQAAAKTHKTDGEIDLSVALSDGQSLYTLRYAENETPSTQFYADDVAWLAQSHKPGLKAPQAGVVVVSEPLNKLDSHWHPVPENSFTIIRNHQVEIEKFM